MPVEWHPLFIHFPIALFSSAVLFDFISILFNKTELLIVSWWVMLLGLVSCVFAIITGFIDDNLIGHFNDISPFWQNHGWVQIISILGFLSLFIWRLKTPNLFDSRKLMLLYMTAGLINVGILFYGSHLGAELAGRI